MWPCIGSQCIRCRPSWASLWADSLGTLPDAHVSLPDVGEGWGRRAAETGNPLVNSPARLGSHSGEKDPTAAKTRHGLLRHWLRPLRFIEQDAETRRGSQRLAQGPPTGHYSHQNSNFFECQPSAKHHAEGFRFSWPSTLIRQFFNCFSCL